MDSCSLESVVDRSCDVGLFRLQSSHLERPEAVKDMISRSGTEWIAVLTPDVLKMKNVGDFVCEWFFDFHTLPFDVSRFQVTLGRAFGMACLRGQTSTLILHQEDELLGNSRSMRDLRKILSKLWRGCPPAEVAQYALARSRHYLRPVRSHPSPSKRSGCKLSAGNGYRDISAL